MSKKNLGAFVGGMVVGSTLGTIIGLLVAPRTGRETRQLIKKSADALPELAEDLSSSVQLQADRLSESALHNWDDTLTRLREAIAAGVEATQLEAQQIKHSREVSSDSSATSSVSDND
ncbi:YtxH domain-containing protein [Oscillatoria salina]|uniref:YtxH domain-containing protein n=1 Tax=Oscillatoria salina TaxID=331517 RepID=UPI0013B83A8D|nr:YtxH domain-containing protein [Oscillatoria salina]MBZ8182260.1 YtxH domain-containing protein [Oscillatoria salina IIICB1]NET91025.1 YtxH domain-containing protein [Kamptonema sp. SIO1D9]